ncbi:MAG: V-type ATP synthase subunit I [Rikenellaceae bacterium]|nr:V-type ATP synthase subunit I [Rikenellaceae bacterium]
MNKYTFVVLASQRADFLARLQELGLVDVTTTGWEPDEDDRALMSAIDRHREAVEHLRQLDFGAGEPYETGAEAFERYSVARGETAQLEGEIARNQKLADEVRPWGAYSPEVVQQLTEQGVVLRYFTTDVASFAKKRDEWAEGRIVEEIAATKEVTYFVVVTSEGDNPEIDAQEVKLPPMNLTEIEAKIVELRYKQAEWQKIFARAAASVDKIETEGHQLASQLQLTRATESGEEAAEGSLVVMEAWARQKQAAEVEGMLADHPDVIFIKARPTPSDQTPVELHNNRVVRPFEFIAEMYALPRYGTMDLTRWFAPFYMLFFAFCLADAGYGLLLFVGGLLLALKGKGAMQAIGKLSMWCGGAAVVFGFLVGSFFGIDIKPWFGDAKIFFPDNDMFLFGAALVLGVLQILFGMVLKAITTTRAFGFKYALATVGWIMVILSGIALLVPSMAGISLGVPPVVFYATIGVGVCMMLFLNNPGKNLFVNLGGGLWNTYNDLTGFLSDALSYIRLFAIGLSGGVLATVFNDLAVGMSPDIPVVGQLVTLVILLIGHGLNLFMSTLSSMVHPLRLTFVEFYKNAGFEATSRTFDPLKKS